MTDGVVIATSRACAGRLLVCDEPVSTLDVSVRAQILNFLLEITRERSMAMLFISHSLPVVRHLSDRPTNPYTQLLTSAASMVSDERGRAGAKMRNAIPSRGCRFVPRCPPAIERCSTHEPELEELPGGHSSCCRLAPGFPLDG